MLSGETPSDNPCPDGYLDGETGECEGIAEEEEEMNNTSHASQSNSDSENQSQSSSHGDESNNNVADCDPIENCSQQNGHCEAAIEDSEIAKAEREVAKCPDMTERIIQTGEEKLI